MTVEDNIQQKKSISLMYYIVVNTISQISIYYRKG